MNPSTSRAPVALALLLFLVANAAAAAQFGDIFKKKKKDQPAQTEQKKEEKKDDKKPEEKKSEGGGGGLFGVKGATGSKQSTDTAAMGFSGVGPDGKVTAEAMNATPTAADLERVQKIAGTTVKQEDLQKFVQEGKLKVRGGGD
jgi:ribosomal protein L12E/L44/L45/RPP1/RPP2